MKRCIHQEASWGFYSFGGGGLSEYDDTIWPNNEAEPRILLSYVDKLRIRLSYVDMSIPYIIFRQSLRLSSRHAHWLSKIDVETEHSRCYKLVQANARPRSGYPNCSLSSPQSVHVCCVDVDRERHQEPHQSVEASKLP